MDIMKLYYTSLEKCSIVVSTFLHRRFIRNDNRASKINRHIEHVQLIMYCMMNYIQFSIVDQYFLIT